MKSLIIALMLLGSAGQTVTAEIVTKELPITVSDVLIPSRVSRDTDVNAVVSGMFSNTCYRWSRGEVKKESANRLTIRAYAWVEQTMCLMVLVPYTKEINIGKLPAGEYTLRFINGDDTYFEKTLTVD